MFLLYPLRPGRSAAWRSIDLLLLALGYGFVLHIFLNYDYYINRIIYIDDLTAWDIFYAVVAVAIVLEATRRVIGLALPLTAIALTQLPTPLPSADQLLPFHLAMLLALTVPAVVNLPPTYTSLPLTATA